MTATALDPMLARAIRIVDSTDLADQIAAWREADQPRGAGGRPAALDDRAVLVLFTTLALRHEPLLINHAVHYLEQCTDVDLDAIGAVQHAADGHRWYDRVWRAFHRFHDVVDPYPAPRNRMLTPADFAEIKAERDPVKQNAKRIRLETVSDALIEASWALLPRHVRRRWNGNVSIDATFTSAFADQYRSKRAGTIEPDSGLYVRGGNHDGSKAGAKVVKKRGWETHIAIATPNRPGIAEFPLLATGITLDRPGVRIAENAVTIFASMQRRGMPAGLAMSDRLYWPGQKPEKLQLPIRALGYTNVNSYKDNELGVQANHAGGIMVDGHWYCPSMPQRLIDASTDRAANVIGDDDYTELIEQRGRYLLRPKNRADRDGYQTLMCPAVGKSATATCPLRDQTHTAPNAAVRVTITAPPAPEQQDRICTQQSVSFPPTAGAKHRQDVRYGTLEWNRLYKNGRSTIEGFNGFVKDGGYELFDDASRRRVRGRTAATIFATVLIVAANARKIDDFLDLHENVAPPRPLKSRAGQRRREHSLRDHHPNIAGPAPHPAASRPQHDSPQPSDLNDAGGFAALAHTPRPASAGHAAADTRRQPTGTPKTSRARQPKLTGSQS